MWGKNKEDSPLITTGDQALVVMKELASSYTLDPPVLWNSRYLRIKNTVGVFICVQNHGFLTFFRINHAFTFLILGTLRRTIIQKQN